ncbi:MAG: methionyl-tRNA formyltransferase [Planctomycetaceae bacterium]|nr:methionyl-tRNA formyltransferase [Planctomycetaceae bacterium]
MKIVMMGTGPFAVPTFEYLLSDGHQIPLLVTRPPVPSKGKELPINPMRVVAEAHGLPVFDPVNVNTADAVAQLQAMKADLLVVCDYGQIVAPSVLGTTRYGGINLHGSLLPKYRGAAPVQWCVFNGDAVSGVSVIHMTPRLDGGPILVQRSIQVEPNETAGELEQRLSVLGVGAVREALDLLLTWDGQSSLGTSQDSSQVTKAPRLAKSQGQVDWTRTAVQIRNQVRAFQPWPGSFVLWQRGTDQPLRLIVIACDVVSELDATNSHANTGNAPPGEIVRSDKNQLWVQTGAGLLALTRVQPAGKRIMDIAEFLRGYAPRTGQRF